MRPAAHAATPAIASDPAFINVPGRTARRTWLRVQQPAANVGSSVGRRRQAPNLLVISMMTRGVGVRQSLAHARLCGPPVIQSRIVWILPFFLICARVCAVFHPSGPILPWFLALSKGLTL